MSISSTQLGDYILKRLSSYDLSLSSEDELAMSVSEESLYNVLSFLQHVLPSKHEAMNKRIKIFLVFILQRYGFIFLQGRLYLRMSWHTLIRENSILAVLCIDAPIPCVQMLILI